MAGLTAGQLHRVTIELYGPRSKTQVKALMAALRGAALGGARIRQEKIVAAPQAAKAKRPRPGRVRRRR